VSVNGPNALQSGRMVLQRRDYAPLAKFGNKGRQPLSSIVPRLTRMQILLPFRIKVLYPQLLRTPRPFLLRYPRARRT
jgi:hypothetical protein